MPSKKTTSKKTSKMRPRGMTKVGKASARPANARKNKPTKTYPRTSVKKGSASFSTPLVPMQSQQMREPHQLENVLREVEALPFGFARSAAQITLRWALGDPTRDAVDLLADLARMNVFEPAAVHGVASVNPVVNGASTHVAVTQPALAEPEEVDPLS